ncbi:lysosome-associated membrane glycoprotein 1-like [Lineus longissimus]|uniref:lysosome-associated membrane glycoprotein 1-like n=1 Tax=Lineus longissimus TaxID=88925 RepID=UPI002B4CEAA1
MEGNDGRIVLLLVFSIGCLFSNVNSSSNATGSPIAKPTTGKPAPAVTVNTPQQSTKGNTPTVAPATTTTPPVPSFVLSQNNKPCLKAAFRAQFTVEYESRKANSTTEMKSAIITLPTSAKVTGTCMSTNITKAELTLSWDRYSIRIYFVERNVDKPDIFSSESEKWLVTTATRLVFSYNTSENVAFESPVKEQEIEASSKSTDLFFENPLNTSYTCISGNDFTLVTEHNTTVSLKLTDVKIQVVNTPMNGYSESHLCEGDKSSPEQNIVPIAVAGCLAGIILIVILGYLISKRTHKPTYTTFDE